MAKLGLRPQGNCVLRTPLLPRDILDHLADGLAVPNATGEALDTAIVADRASIRAKLRALIARPDVREAIFVASPSLHSSIDGWLAKPDSDAGLKTERGLIRYIARMAARPTPFGLFAGNTVGTIGETTRFELAPRTEYRRYSRLDGDYLSKLTDMLAADPAVRRSLPHRPNSSLYKIGGGLRYALRREGAARAYTLVNIEATDYLVATLQRAHDGALPGALAEALCSDDPEVTREEADAYVADLIDAQILVSDLAPLVTGVEAIDDVIQQLTAIGDEGAQRAAQLLTTTRTGLIALDQQIGNEAARYRALHESLGPLPVVAELNRLFQVNLVPVAVTATLGHDVVNEVIAALEMLRRLPRPPQTDDLSQFKAAFAERYEDREVLLVEALDEETGIGFAASLSPTADASPLLEGLPFPGGAGDSSQPWRSHLARLGRRIAEALAVGASEVVLDDTDFDAMASTTPAPFPDALSTVISIAQRDGEFLVDVGGAYGPSGANLLGRFCHSDEALHEVVRQQLAAEAALQPDVIFAEVVHLADGRLANISARPVLRDHEIVFLGRSGAARDRQIPITDLTLSIRGGRLVLRSIALEKEVLPRLTNAHNFTARSLGTYRFLASLQEQRALGLGIGPLEALPHVPRIRHGRVVLRQASWRLTKDQTGALTMATGAARIKAVRELRAAAGLPRWICVEDIDNVLPVDLDNVVALDSFAHLIKNRDSVTLSELWPAPDELAVRGPDGRYAHEIVVPLVRVPAELPAQEGRRVNRQHARSVFPPGSEWLYAKLFTGRATADQILTEVITPIASALPAWFFIRYGDPHWHVRLRVHGEPAWLMTEVMPKLAAATRPLLDDGRMWKLQLDTYEREVHRYGGPVGVELAERLFCADSACVVEILAMLSGDEGADLRWRFALRGIDQLLDDLGFDLATKHKVMARARDDFAREHRVETFVPFQRALGDRYRKERTALEAILDRTLDEASDSAPALARFAVRSRANEPIIAELREAEQRRALAAPLEVLAQSYVHMHVNRLLRSSQRAHELVLYDLLARLYESRIARARRGR